MQVAGLLFSKQVCKHVFIHLYRLVEHWAWHRLYAVRLRCDLYVVHYIGFMAGSQQTKMSLR